MSYATLRTYSAVQHGISCALQTLCLAFENNLICKEREDELNRLYLALQDAYTLCERKVEDEIKRAKGGES